MQQDALLRSRLLSSFRTESKARRSHQHLSGLGTPSSGLNEEDGPLGGFPSPLPVAAATANDPQPGFWGTISTGAAPVSTDNGDGGRPTSSLAAAAAAAAGSNRPLEATNPSAPPPGHAADQEARGRSISFSLSLPSTSADAGAGGAGVAVPPPVSVAGPAERYTTLDLFPEYPEQFLPQVQDFQRVIILNTPEPPDSDTQAACKQLRKAMKLRTKWLGVPLEPEARVTGPGAREPLQPPQQQAQQRAESPICTHAPGSPGSPRSVQSGGMDSMKPYLVAPTDHVTPEYQTPIH